MNYHMNKIDSTLLKLLNMLATAEGTLKDSKGMVLAMERTFFKRKTTWKKKEKKPLKKQKTRAKPKKDIPKKAKDKKNIFTVMLKATEEETVRHTWRWWRKERWMHLLKVRLSCSL